jgi:hypothetical protein
MKQLKKVASKSSETTDASSTPITPKKVNKKGKLPKKDNDFGTLSKAVNKKWKTMPAITLLYITQAEFEGKVNLFDSTLGNRQTTGGKRSPLTQQLKNKDALIRKGISGIKTYLKDKYEGDAISYYSLFGIEKIGKNYELPTDKDKRKDVLDIIITAIASEGFGNEKYGTAFWTLMKTDYTKLLKDANDNDSSVSSDVGKKTVLKDEIEEVLNSIIYLIKGNYPKTWEAELRNWGFLKEHY